MSDGGKGSAPRPFSVSHEKFSRNWDSIFKKQKQEQPSEYQINKNGELERHHEQYWTPAENEK